MSASLVIALAILFAIASGLLAMKRKIAAAAISGIASLMLVVIWVVDHFNV